MSDRLLRLPRLAILALLVAGSAHAQYKWIDTDGTVSYGDRMPPAGARVLATPRGPLATASAGATLPYALRSAVERYPVTLFTTPSCAPCDMARAHLNKRGIPFSERVVSRQADADALRQLGLTGTMLPGLKVGRESADGFESGSWDRMLDAAGYPRTSMLPAGYRRSPVTDLAARPAPRQEGYTDGSEARTAATEDRAPAADTAPPTAFANSAGAPFLLPAMPRSEAPASSVRF